MKKYISLLLTAVLIFGCASCSRDNTDIPSTEEPELTVFTEESTYSFTTEEYTTALSENADTVQTEKFETTTKTDESVFVPTNDKTEDKTTKTTKEEDTYTVSETQEFTTKVSKTDVTNEETYEETSKNSTLETTSFTVEYTSEAVVTKEEETETEAETRTENETETKKEKKLCTLTIICSSVLKNYERLSAAKQMFIPKSGIILEKTEVEIEDGDTVFEILKKACSDNVCSENCSYCQASGIQFEYTYTPAFGNYYIEGIHQLYEKDCGSLSGWMYSVNGSFPNVGVSSYSVHENDEITLIYTCDMGEDIGNSF